MEKGPVCIITGASGGIASGIARKLSADGYRLLLMSRGGCADLAEELGQTGFSGSVLEDEDVEGAVEEVVSRYGRLDAAVFSGGRQGDILKEFDVPAGRYGAVEEIAATVAFLLSEGAGYITGQTVVADGGVNRNPGM